MPFLKMDLTCLTFENKSQFDPLMPINLVILGKFTFWQFTVFHEKFIILENMPHWPQYPYFVNETSANAKSGICLTDPV